MPSPKTILADITDLGLNPKHEYTVTSKQGRLMPEALSVHVQPVFEKTEEPKFVSEPVVIEPVEEPIVEQVSVDPVVPDVIDEVETQTVPEMTQDVVEVVEVQNEEVVLEPKVEIPTESVSDNTNQASKKKKNKKSSSVSE